MNPAQTAQFLAWVKKNELALTAFAKGEQLQGRFIDGSPEWTDVDKVYSDLKIEYRIKPAPRTLYMVEIKLEAGWIGHYQSYDKKMIDVEYDHVRRAYPQIEYRLTEFIEKQ